MHFSTGCLEKLWPKYKKSLKTWLAISSHSLFFCIRVKGWSTSQWAGCFHTLGPHSQLFPKWLLWSCWLGCSSVTSGPFFRDKDHHPAQQTNVTVPEISMSFERFITLDTLISRALITSAQILSTVGTLPLWRPMQWPLPKRWAKTLLPILRRGCYCQVWIWSKPFFRLQYSERLSVIYLLILKNNVYQGIFSFTEPRGVDLWLIPSVPTLCRMCGGGKSRLG